MIKCDSFKINEVNELKKAESMQTRIEKSTCYQPVF